MENYNPNDSGMSIFAIIVLALSALNFCGCGASFVFGPLGLPLLFLTSVAGVVVGKIELSRIARGESPAGGKIPVMIGFCWCIANVLIAVAMSIASAGLIAAYFVQQSGG